MHCVIYKGARRPDTYLFVEREDDFGRVPEALLELLGPLQRIMSLELTSERTLVQADVREVRRRLHSQGYYLQWPPGARDPQPF